MKNRNKIGTVILGAALLLGSTFAYFTDFKTVDHTAKTATVEISDLNLELIVGNLELPGDEADFSYWVENLGSVDIKTRETYVITVDGVVLEEVSSPFEVSGGIGDLAETDTIVYEDGSIKGEFGDSTLGSGLAHGRSINIKFNELAGNEYQDKTITVNLVVEAMQDRNTDNSTWAVARTETITINGSDVQVVPGK